MELNINNNTLVKNIQEEFTAHYPYLKIEILALPKKERGYSKLEKIAPTTAFRSLQTIATPISISIHNKRTVANLEKDFRDRTGLRIQVYRKSGNVWIETSLTDDWTLGRQNVAGEVLSFQPISQQKTG